MSGKNLTFKLVMDADTKDYVSNTKQAQDVTIKVFDTIKSEAQKVKVTELVQGLHDATKEITDLGDKSTISGTKIREMSMQSQQMVASLNNELVEAQAELVRLSQSKASPTDISNAINRVADLKSSIQDVQAAFGAYQSVATNAMTGVDKATGNTIAEVQKFTNVDLSNVVGEAQNATRAIESMGDGATASAKDVERIEQLGVAAIGSLERELLAARNAFAALDQSSEAITLEEIKAAGDKVKGLEQALGVTQGAFSKFELVAGKAMDGVGSEAQKVVDSAQKAGHEIYDALGIKPPAVINDAIANLNQKLEDFKKNSQLPAEEVTRVAKITEQEIERLKGELSGIEPAANSANSGVSNLSKGLDAAKFAATALVGALGALGVGLGLRELAQAADSYTNLSARINIATREGGNFNQAMAGVHQVALMTNSSLDATGDLFTRINAISQDMGMSQQQALDLTKIVTQAIQIGGGSAQASEAAVQQFIQAMQGGVLRGEEFNSIMENGYGLAEALAKGLGVTTGELRKMAENGELSSERVIKAIQSRSASIQETYNQFPTTISNALQKIATSWQILIGEMDQANGASATVAQWLSTLADNMSLLKPIIDDIGQGLIRFGDYYSSIYDQATLDSLKTALVSIYNTIKTLFNTVLEVGEATNDLFSDALSAVLGFTDGLYPAGQQVSGFQKFIDLLNIAIGLLSDGFKSIGIVVNLFTGTLYGLASAWYEFKSIFTWGDVKDQAIANMEAMRAKSQEYFDKGFDGIKNFESQTLSSIDNIKKSEEQKNQELIADNQKKLDELKAQESKHQSAYKAISDERLRLEQQLFDARKSGNQASIDLAMKGLAELDAKEKAYQAEGQKITDAKIESAQAIATAMIQSADAAGMAQLKVLNAQLATQGLKAEFDSTGKVIVSAMDDGTKATENQSNAMDKARKAAAALGIDLDIALNRVSEKFASDQGHLKNYANGLEAMGATGAQATELIYQGWQKWAEQAKSPAEIDAAKAQLDSFEKQGVFSAKQVEMGMRYLDEVNGKLPANISEVEKAYKLLGITSSAEANKMADAQMKAFNVMTKSGTASAEQIRQALINMADKIYASGDAAKIAWYEGQFAANGLASSVDDAGRKSVSAMSSLEDANKRVRDSARSAISGYRELGDAVRQEAKSSIEAWNEMMDARSKAEKENKTQRVGADFTTYNVSDIQSKLSGMGYDEAEAAKIAKNILNQGLEIDKNKARDARARGDEYTAKAFEKLLNNGQTSAFGTQKVNELLARYMSGQGSATAGTKSAAVNALAPEVNVAVPTTNVEQSKERVVQNNITINGKTISVPVGESSQGSFDEFLSELEQLKRAM